MRAALDSGHVSGAAFDVFIEEPATANPLFGHPNFIATPHLGASTNEAQENVALQVAEQMSDYLTRGAISNAINFPSITAEEAPKLKPFIALGGGSRLIRRPAHASADPEGHAHLRGRGRRTQNQGVDVGRDRRAAASLAGRHQCRVGAHGRRPARHRHRGNDPRRGWRLRKLHHADRRDGAANAGDWRHRFSGRQAAHPFDQGDQGRRRIHALR